MKNRRNMIVAFLVCACLIVGVGYAALTDTLNINGTATISADAATEEFDEDVYFQSAVNNDGTATVELVEGTGDSEDKADGATITIENTIGVLGDTSVSTFTVMNEANSAVTITVAANNTNPNFRVTADQTTYNIPAGESIEVVVTVTLLVTVDADTPISGESFSIGFTATSAG